MPPIEGEWVRAELEAISNETGAAAKGKRLEALVRRTFCVVPGLSLDDQDIVNAYGTQEIDLYFFNARDRDGLHFLDCPLIIECKSWVEPVDGREIRYFADLLRDKGRRDGIFIALNGITGDPETLSAGLYHVTRALADGQLVLVMTGDDLAAAYDPDRLVALLRRRMLDQVKGQVLAMVGLSRKRKGSAERSKRP